MFLEKLKETNSELLSFAFEAQQNGSILPDTYLLDLDTIVENGKAMIQVAKENNVSLFFMLKQIGRNPRVAQKLMEIGFDGCVAVDFKEALLMIDNKIPLGNVGHLVQTPKAALKKIIQAEPKVMTVYSIEKIREINLVACELHRVQPLLLRITDEDSDLYSGQVGGFLSEHLNEVIDEIEELHNVSFGGLTVFPALLYSDAKKQVIPTDNIKCLNRALDIVKHRGYKDFLVNVPSATCCASIPLISSLKGNNGEPGHGLTGTTPLHKYTEQPEKVGYVYVSEISHNYLDKSYCYGGGHYRRGHMQNALVGKSLKQAKLLKVVAPDDDSIDYHYEINEPCEISDAVVMCYRTQVFTTRSHVAIVEGINEHHPKITGIYNSIGEKIERNW